MLIILVFILMALAILDAQVAIGRIPSIQYAPLFALLDTSLTKTCIFVYKTALLITSLTELIDSAN